MGLAQGSFFQYLASGKPVCCNRSVNYCLVSKYNLGVAKDFENSEAYAEAILSISQLDRITYNAMCERVKEVAKQFDYQVLSGKLIELCQSYFQ